MSEVHVEPVVASPPPVPVAAPKGKAHADSSGMNSLQSLATTIVIAVFVITFVVQAFQIPSESMEKTLLVGDYLLVDKAHFADTGPWGWLLPYRRIKRQDIVVFRYPLNPQQHFVKRVVGVPGDHVRLVNKHVYVNGIRQEEDFVLVSGGRRKKPRNNPPNGGFSAKKIASKCFTQAQKLVD